MSNKLNGAVLLDEEDCARILYSVLHDDSIKRTPEVEKVLRVAYDALRAQNDLHRTYVDFIEQVTKTVSSRGNYVEYLLCFRKLI